MPPRAGAATRARARVRAPPRARNAVAARASRPRFQMLMMRESFCTRLSSRSPCLIAAWYCAFLVSGRVDETMPATLSIVHESRPLEMNAASSVSRYASETPKVPDIDASETDRYDSRNCVSGHTARSGARGTDERQSTRASIRLQSAEARRGACRGLEPRGALTGHDAQLAVVVARVRCEEAVALEGSVEDVDERAEEGAVLAVVQPVEQPRQVRDLVDDLQNLRRVDHLRRAHTREAPTRDEQVTWPASARGRRQHCSRERQQGRRAIRDVPRGKRFIVGGCGGYFIEALEGSGSRGEEWPSPWA